MYHVDTVTVQMDALLLAANCCRVGYSRINNHLHDRNQRSLLCDEEKWKVQERSEH